MIKEYFQKRSERKEADFKAKVEAILLPEINNNYKDFEKEQKRTDKLFLRQSEIDELIAVKFKEQKEYIKDESARIDWLYEHYDTLTDELTQQRQNLMVMGLCLSLRGEMMYNVLDKVANPEITDEQMKRNRPFFYDNEVKQLKQALAKEMPEKSKEEIEQIINEFYGK